MAKVLKNYRLSQSTIEKLEALQAESDKTATDIIEAAINYIHQEYTRALQGKDVDPFTLVQVLGKKIDKAV